MTLRVISLDFDGCLFHSGYIQQYAEKGTLDVIATNQPFLDSLKAQNSNYTQTIVMVGSNRQSKEIDVLNSYNKGSCFPQIKKISDYLSASLDKFLLADVYGQLPSGTSFNKAQDDIEGVEQHASWVFDESKATLLYAQMHKLAHEHLDEHITFDFYDDREDILDGLHSFFNPALIPQNITLRLHQYAGDKAPLSAEKYSILGEGICDKNYRQTVKDMMEMRVLPNCEHPYVLPNRAPSIGTPTNIYRQLDNLLKQATELNDESDLKAITELCTGIKPLVERYSQKDISELEFVEQGVPLVQPVLNDLKSDDLAYQLINVSFTMGIGVPILPPPILDPSETGFTDVAVDGEMTFAPTGSDYGSNYDSEPNTL